MGKIYAGLSIRWPKFAWRLAVLIPRLRPTRVLGDHSRSCAEGHSARRINALAQQMPRAQKYLEIGVKGGGTLEQVRVEERVAVDPYPDFDLTKLPEGVTVRPTTSDRFFAELADHELFDLVFIDGLHEWMQTYRDLINSFRHLNRGGLILIDDVVPLDEIASLPSQVASYKLRRQLGSNVRSWQGDVYKVIFVLHDLHPEVDYRVIVEEGDNCQAIAWLKPGHEVLLIDTERLQREYGPLTFRDCFPNESLPECFRPLPESEACHLAVRESGR